MVPSKQFLCNKLKGSINNWIGIKSVEIDVLVHIGIKYYSISIKINVAVVA